jgi:hypothetical protein
MGMISIAQAVATAPYIHAKSGVIPNYTNQKHPGKANSKRNCRRGKSISLWGTFH